MEAVIGADAGAAIGSMVAARTPVGVVTMIVTARGDGAIRSASVPMPAVVPRISLGEAGGAERHDNKGSNDGSWQAFHDGFLSRA
jgi:hypothetical protein